MERHRSEADLLVAEGRATPEQITECLREIETLASQGITPLPRLSDILVRKGYTPPTALLPSDLPPEVASAARNGENTVGHYVRVRMLGSGGMGEVWKAWDLDLARWVALKFVKHDNLTELARFRREAQTAARLNHPNIAAIYEADEYAIAMQLIEGRTLGSYPRDNVRTLARLLRDAALAVHYAHQKGVLHRDLKPANFMVDREGRLYVMDFGLAKSAGVDASLSASGAILGTPSYMSPEQALGRTLDARSDVYSLGATLYELLTGRPPFESENMYEILKRVTEEEPVGVRRLRRGVDGELETIVMKCLEKEAERRYRTAAEVAQELSRWLEGEPIKARPPSLVYRLRKQVKGHRGWVAAGVVGMVVLGIAVGVTVLKLRAAKEELKAGQAAVLEQMRLTARTCLESALGMRRAGLVREMEQFVKPLEEAYRRVIERAPEIGEAYYLRGRMMRALMREEEALRMQKEALKRSPHLMEALYEHAIVSSAHYQRRYQMALMSWRQQQGEEIKGNSGKEIRDPEPKEVESIDPMLTKLREAIVKDIGAIEALPGHLGEARRLAASGILAAYTRTGNAEALLEEALKKDPSLEEVFQTLGEVASDAEKRIAWYTQGLERDRGYLPYFLGRGLVRQNLGEQEQERGHDPGPFFEKAIEDFEGALALFPAHAETHISRGRCRVSWGNYAMTRGRDPSPLYEKALEDFTQDSTLAEAWMNRGRIETNLGIHEKRNQRDPAPHYEKAIEAYGRVLELHPLFPMAWVGRGAMRLNWGFYLHSQNQDPVSFYTQAIEDFGRALELDPSLARGWFGRGQVWTNWAAYRQDKGSDPRTLYEKAVADFEHVSRMTPESIDVWKQCGQARINWGNAECLQGRDGAPFYRKALEDFTRAVDLSPASAESRFGRGDAALNFAEALERRHEIAEVRMLKAAATNDFTEVHRLNPALASRLGNRLERARQNR